MVVAEMEAVGGGDGNDDTVDEEIKERRTEPRAEADPDLRQLSGGDQVEDTGSYEECDADCAG